ncbi:hypothetical protein ACP70R_014078 [Stipagrostis hirtigluma subsp. patula]
MGRNSRGSAWGTPSRAPLSLPLPEDAVAAAATAVPEGRRHRPRARPRRLPPPQRARSRSPSTASAAAAKQSAATAPPRSPVQQNKAERSNGIVGRADGRRGDRDLRVPGRDQPAALPHHEHLQLQQGDVPPRAHLQRIHALDKIRFESLTDKSKLDAGRPRARAPDPGDRGVPVRQRGRRRRRREGGRLERGRHLRAHRRLGGALRRARPRHPPPSAPRPHLRPEP